MYHFLFKFISTMWLIVDVIRAAVKTSFACKLEKTKRFVKKIRN